MILGIAIKLFVVTIVMVGLMIGLSRYAQRGGSRRGTAMRVSGRQGIAKNAVVAVVEIDGRRFLVGAGDGQVSMLAELDPAEETAEESEVDGDRRAATAPLSTRIGEALTAAYTHARTAPHGTAAPTTTTGPRIGPLDRLRAMTVRTERPIHVPDRQ